MYEPNTTLREIIVNAVDNCVCVEIYPSDAAPPFKTEDAIKRFSATENTEFLGFGYDKKVISLSRAKRTSKKERNSFTVGLDNLSREIATFEFTEGFEGKILVLREISRSLSTDVSHSLIFFVGKCEKPNGGNKKELSVTANQVYGSTVHEIPRRKFTPEDPQGRAASDPLFEGFPYIPQYGTTVYPRIKRSFFGLFKKQIMERLQYSSFSDIDANKSLPFPFGRVQIEGTNLGYVDIGNHIRVTTAFTEGEIKAYLRIYSTDPRFSGPLGGGHTPRGELGGVGGQQPVTGPPELLPWIANGYYSKTAWAAGVYLGTAVDQVDPAPGIVATILAKMVFILGLDNEFDVYDWSDNAAALIRFFDTDSDYENLDPAWLDEESYAEAYRYNNEFLFDNSFSDLIFVPAGTLESNIESAGLRQPTSNVTPEYLKYLRGEMEAEEVFALKAKTQEIDLESEIPIEPGDIPDPGDPPWEVPSAINLSVFLRRRYTCNVVANEKQKLSDFKNEVILASSRMFETQGFDGRKKLRHKKPVDFALGLAGFAANTNTLSVDDVSYWITNKTGFLLIQPHSDISEVRKVLGSQYTVAQNSVSLSASSNISIDGFSGSDGANTPAAATITVNSVLAGDSNYITLDNEQIQVIAVEADDPNTLAGFFYGSINAHPRLRRKFKAEWLDNEVIITAKFGALTLDANIELSHPAPVDNPASPPILSASAGTLAAGTYYVAYAFENANGRTLQSQAASITLEANQKIEVEAVATPNAETSVVWYVSPEANSFKLRKIHSSDGSAFEIDALPRLTGELPNDFNRTGTEVLRVAMVFADQPSVRNHAPKSNIIKDSLEWILGRREDAVNLVSISFRDASQDFRLVELKIRDEEHIAKVKKENKLEIDGSAIDSFHQAFRIGSGAMAEARDAAHFHKWQSDREALFLEEFDVVCVTDAGAGVVNFPVIIEDIEYDDLISAHPTATFTARKYSSTLYDDSVVGRQIPVIQSLDQNGIEFDDGFDGTLATDLEFTTDNIGVILVDRTTEARYRIYVDNGVIELEELS